MKRVVLVLACLLVLLTLTLPSIALAAQSKSLATTTTAGGTTVVAPLIVYPTPPPDATAADAKASTEWQKSGDISNLVYALLGVVASFGIVVWGVLASRKASAA